MNINLIKEDIKKLCNIKLKLKINLGRNKYEYLEGYINKMHSNLFTVSTNKGLKSFSYTDVLVKNVILTKFL